MFTEGNLSNLERRRDHFLLFEAAPLDDKPIPAPAVSQFPSATLAVRTGALVVRTDAALPALGRRRLDLPARSNFVATRPANVPATTFPPVFPDTVATNSTTAILPLVRPDSREVHFAPHTAPQPKNAHRFPQGTICTDPGIRGPDPNILDFVATVAHG